MMNFGGTVETIPLIALGMIVESLRTDCGDLANDPFPNDPRRESLIEEIVDSRRCFALDISGREGS